MDKNIVMQVVDFVFHMFLRVVGRILLANLNKWLDEKWSLNTLVTEIYEKLWNSVKAVPELIRRIFEKLNK